MMFDTTCRNFLWQRNLPINFGLEKCILLLQGTLTTNAIVANRETRNRKFVYMLGKCDKRRLFYEGRKNL